MDKISVIIPIYKTEKLLNKCIKSVVNQTFLNLEIILVDDGSPDNCPQICDEWANKDERIIVIHKENEGVSSARNTGLNVATGNYISFIDADDYIEKDYHEKLINNIIEKNSDISSCGYIFEFGSYSERMIIDDLCYNNALLYLLNCKIRPEVHGKLYKASIIGNTRFNTAYGYGEDLLFNYEVFKKGLVISQISECMYHYVQNSGNSSTTPIITDYRAKSYRIFLGFVEDCRHNEELYSAAVWRFTTGTYSILSRVMQNSEYRERYYDEISDAIIGLKKQILKNQRISVRNKALTLILSLNKSLFKKIVLTIRNNGE